MLKAEEVLEIINKQWATKSDIKKIGNIGIDKSTHIFKEIYDEAIEEGWNLPNTRLIPMEKVVKYFKININYLKKVRKEVSK